MTAMDAPARTLPPWRSVLAVVAHPDDESFGLGGVLAAFAAAGTRVSVLCFTRGEASTLHGVAGDLHEVRAGELEYAARALGADRTWLHHHPDGGLPTVCRTALAGEVMDAVRAAEADALVAFDTSGVTGHPDHAAATAAALEAARILGLPVLGWTLPAHVARALNEERGTAFTGSDETAVDYVISVDRDRQRTAIAAHASQAVPTSILWRRLELLGDREYLRRLDHVESRRSAS